MLSDDERRQIEADAASRVRAEWGHVNARALGDIVAEIRAFIEDGTWGQRSLAGQLSEIIRLAHAHAVFAKDEAASEQCERGREGPEAGE